MCIRMQPWLAAVPDRVVGVGAVEADARRGRADPARAQRVARPGRDGRELGRPRRVGRVQVGSTCLSLISYLPVGVG